MTSPAHTKGILAGIKRRLFRSTPRTPYDRPPTAARGLRNTTSVNESDTNGRLSKFVESVSSLIPRIAFKFFSFVCRKRLTEHSVASGSSKNLFVKLDVPTVNLVEQRLTEANSLSTSKDNGISDIEKQIIHRRIERAKVIHLLKMINSQSSKIHNSELENKPKKVLKRDHTFLDDDEPLLCRPHKIQKKLVEKEKQVVDNISFTTIAMEGAIATNDMNDAFTSSISSSLIIKSTNTTASCHATLPLQRNSGVEFIDQDQEIDQDEMVVENAPFTTPISEDVIATNGMNDASSLSRRSIISSTNVPISSHVALPSQRKPSFHMPVPEFLDLDEENDETNTYVQSSFDLDQPKSNLLEQRSSNIHKYEVENKPKKVLKRDHTFLDDDESLLCLRPHKIHKKLGEKEKQVVDIPFTTTAMEGAIATNDMNDAFTSSRSISPIIKSTNSTTSCHVTLPLQKNSEVEFIDENEEVDQDDMFVENASLTTAISEDVIATNDMNDASSLSRSRRSIISSTNAIIFSHVALPSAPAFLDFDEENDETNIYVQSSMDLDQPKSNLLEQKSSNIHKSEIENKTKKFIDENEEIDQDEMVVENAQFTTTISEDEMATNDMNDASTLSRSRGSIISFTNSIISSHVALPSAPAFLDLEEENDETNIYVQSSMDLDQLKSNLLEQKSSEVENKPKKFIDEDEEIDQNEMIVENAPFTTTIAEDVIATNDMNDASSLSRSRRSIISSINDIISSHVAVPSAPEFLDLDEENDETNICVQSSMDLDQPKSNLQEQKSSKVENKPKKVLKRGRSFLNDEESLLCPPRKIHKKLGEKEKQVADNILFTTTTIEGAIAANDMNNAFTSSRNSSTIINSTKSTASCHATLPSQRKPSFHVSTPEFLDIDEENDETNI